MSFERPVARSLVHRRSANEVFPTDLRTHGPDTFTMALQWPRCHAFFRPDQLDSALLTETIRQVTILTCHLGYDVPVEQKFLMTGLGFTRHTSRFAAAAGRALELTAGVTGRQVKRAADGSLRSVRMDIELRDPDGECLASGHGDALIVTPALYARIRGTRRAAEPPQSRRPGVLDHPSVGASHPVDVLLAQSRDGMGVSVAREHPIYFDHLLDHVPGIALIEACRQLASLETRDPGVELDEFEGEFLHIVEFEEPTIIELKRDDRTVVLAIVQSGAVALSARGTLRSSVRDEVSA